MINLVRLNESVHINPDQIVCIVPAPMLSNAQRFDVHFVNGYVHAWPIEKGEEAEASLSRLMALLA